MNKFRKILAVSLLSVVLIACNDDDDVTHAPVPQTPPAPTPAPATPTADLRIVHAVPDAPSVNVYAGSDVLAGLENVDYQVASPWITVDEGTYSVRVEANIPGGNADVISADLVLEGEKSYNVLAVGNTAGASIEPLVVAVDRSPVTSGNVRVQVVHAAPEAPAVDIYVTAPETDIDSEQPLATAAFKDSTGQVEVAGGNYQIRITAAGTKTVVFDSGTVALPADADLLITATENTGTGTSPVTLFVSDGTNFFNIWDINSAANLRVIHGVADAPAVDVNANNQLTIVDGAPFLAATAYIPLASGDYLIDIAADSNNAVVIDDAAITLEQGKFYSAIANGSLSALDLDLLTDVPRAVATEARVRIIHASPSAGNVDIYVTADGMIDNVSANFSNVGYITETLAETGYVSLPGGDYIVTVTAAGTKTKAIETGILSLSVGNIYTAIAVDGNSTGDLPQLILLDALDSTPPALPQPNLRVTHASSDAPTVNVLANEVMLLSNVDYQISSSWLSVPANTYMTSVVANLPGGASVEVIAAELKLSANKNYDVLAIGSVAAGTLSPLVLSNDNFSVAYDNIRVQVIHAVPEAPEVDIYVTVPDADLAAVSPVATASYGEFTGQLIVPAAEYQIRLTLAGTETVVFDSGSVTLTAGADLLITATPNIATGASPVSLLVSDGAGSSVILDVNATADIRVVHAVADAPAVDVIANNTLTLVDGAAFKDVTEYLNIAGGNYLLDIAADEGGALVIDDAPLSVGAGNFYTAIANNTLSSLDLDVLVDTRRSIATAAQVRIIHASPAAGLVDIYVTADGAIDNVSPAFSSVPYSSDVLAETGYVSLAAGDYVVSVTATGSKTKALDTGVLNLESGMIYTAIAVDGNTPGDAPQLILMDGLGN